MTKKPNLPILPGLNTRKCLTRSGSISEAKHSLRCKIFKEIIYACKMIATLQTIYYFLVELLSPPEKIHKRFITRECVSKIMNPTRDEDGFPISGQDMVP